LKQNFTYTQARDNNSKFRKPKTAVGRHFENGYISIISAANRPI